MVYLKLWLKMAGHSMSVLLKHHIQLTIWQAIKQSMPHGGVIPYYPKAPAPQE